MRAIWLLIPIGRIASNSGWMQVLMDEVATPMVPLQP
jgi:hypothetical protein